MQFNIIWAIFRTGLQATHVAFRGRPGAMLVIDCCSMVLLFTTDGNIPQESPGTTRCYFSFSNKVLRNSKPDFVLSRFVWQDARRPPRWALRCRANWLSLISGRNWMFLEESGAHLWFGGLSGCLRRPRWIETSFALHHQDYSAARALGTAGRQSH